MATDSNCRSILENTTSEIERPVLDHGALGRRQGQAPRDGGGEPRPRHGASDGAQPARPEGTNIRVGVRRPGRRSRIGDQTAPVDRDRLREAARLAGNLRQRSSALFLDHVGGARQRPSPRDQPQAVLRGAVRRAHRDRASARRPPQELTTSFREGLGDCKSAGATASDKRRVILRHPRHRLRIQGPTKLTSPSSPERDRPPVFLTARATRTAKARRRRTPSRRCPRSITRDTSADGPT